MEKIGSTTVLADIKTPSIRNTTRWDYVSRYLETWVDARQSRTYAAVCALVGVLMLVRSRFSPCSRSPRHLTSIPTRS